MSMGTQVLLEEIPRNPVTYTFEAVRKRESAVETQVSLQEQPSDPQGTEWVGSTIFCMRYFKCRP